MTEVTQKDRETAEGFGCGFCPDEAEECLAAAFAAHRIAADRAGYERGQRETVERIVAWIRTGAMFAYTDQEMADAIEAGEWK